VHDPKRRAATTQQDNGFQEFKVRKWDGTAVRLNKRHIKQQRTVADGVFFFVY
jgi:hypothetical protein